MKNPLRTIGTKEPMTTATPPYDPASPHAEEFINHEEILATLEAARADAADLALVDRILEKAAEGNGLTHREASVLLACEDKARIERIFALARAIKDDHYGNRIVLFAPLYLSNYCMNGCVYCPYHLQNKTIPRKKLTQEEIAAEVIALQDQGHKRLAIELGEDPINNPIEYVLESLQTIYSIKHKNGAIRRAPRSVPTSCFRRPTTKSAMRNFIPRDRRATTPTTPKRTTARWKRASTMWAWAFSSAWRAMPTNSLGCSCMPNISKRCSA